MREEYSIRLRLTDRFRQTQPDSLLGVLGVLAVKKIIRVISTRVSSAAVIGGRRSLP